MAAAAAQAEAVAAPAEALPEVVADIPPEVDDDGTDDAEVEEEGESREGGDVASDEIRYTSDLTDEALAEKWQSAPETLGSISIGFADEGRLVNAVPFPEGAEWIIVDPQGTWATRETVDFVLAAIKEVKRQFPDAPPLRVNHMSGPEGGYLRKHKSHQSGRDVDLGFYYPGAEPVRVREREKYIDVAKNWALLKALVTLSDVQMVLLDRRVQKVLYDHALKSGEDKAWLDSLFKGGKDSVVRHARRHRDHFHVRFYNPRAQELGRRVAPMLALRPEQNILMHRVRSGDTLGAIAAKYDTSVQALKKVNQLRSSFLRISQMLKVPLRKPCTRCPVPPPVVVPPRRLPPTMAQQPAESQHAGAAM